MKNPFTDDLGEKKRILLIGGLLGNLQATEAIMHVAHDKNFLPENIISGGDNVGYCAEPESVIKVLRTKWPIYSIAGNVEYQIANGRNECGCGFDVCSSSAAESKKWYAYAQEELVPESVMWMKGLPRHISFNMNGKKVMVVHGAYAPKNPDELATYIFESTSTEIKLKEIKQAQCDIMVGNHSGLPFIQEISEKMWVNPGTIGLTANEKIPRAWYMVMEVVGEKIQMELCSLSYDSSLAVAKIRSQGEKMSQRYADILEQGPWGSECIIDVFLANDAQKEAEFCGMYQEQSALF